MGLSKRKSRKINVDGHDYLWSPSKDSGYVILLVQDSSGKGAKLEIVISNDKNIIIENGSYSIEVGDANKTIITPKLVEKMIKDSINMGWKPLVRASSIKFFYDKGNLVIRPSV